MADLEAATEAEERGEAPPPVDFPPTAPAFLQVRRAVTRDLCVQFVRRALSLTVYATQPPRLAAKLLKDVPHSIRRKALRPSFTALPATSRAAAVGATALRGHACVVTAELLVQEACALYTAVCNARAGQRSWRLLLRLTAQNVAKALASAGGAAAGCAAFALVLPADAPRKAYWCSYAAIVCGEIVGQLAASHATDAWVKAVGP